MTNLEYKQKLEAIVKPFLCCPIDNCRICAPRLAEVVAAIRKLNEETIGPDYEAPTMAEKRTDEQIRGRLNKDIREVLELFGVDTKELIGDWNIIRHLVNVANPIVANIEADLKGLLPKKYGADTPFPEGGLQYGQGFNTAVDEAVAAIERYCREGGA